MDTDVAQCRGIGCEASCSSRLKFRVLSRGPIFGRSSSPLANPVGPAGIYSVKRGAVQALKKDGAICIVVDHKDADLCIQERK